MIEPFSNGACRRPRLSRGAGWRPPLPTALTARSEPLELPGQGLCRKRPSSSELFEPFGSGSELLEPFGSGSCPQPSPLPVALPGISVPCCGRLQRRRFKSEQLPDAKPLAALDVSAMEFSIEPTSAAQKALMLTDAPHSAMAREAKLATYAMAAMTLLTTAEHVSRGSGHTKMPALIELAASERLSTAWAMSTAQVSRSTSVFWLCTGVSAA
mmetsp:Transcript_15354/g.48371  ORF Transcript_15354/g.48371 Transcript_15354/m.48371 type:complete len:213 (-) Transcript_15354:127-765(-)